MGCTQYILFTLHAQTYGIELGRVKEVMAYRKITPLPHQRGMIQGVINLRGIILPVFDLRGKFGLPSPAYTAFHVIIVMEIAGRIMGIIADEIDDVTELPPDQMQSTHNLPPGMETEYLKAVGKIEQKLIILLDIDRLLSLEELEKLDAV